MGDEILLIPHRVGMLLFRGRALHLGPQESAIIEDLAANPGKVRTADDFAARIWADRRPEDWPEDYLALVEHRMVKVRKALPPRYVMTVYHHSLTRAFALHGGRNKMIGWRLCREIQVEGLR